MAEFDLNTYCFPARALGNLGTPNRIRRCQMIHAVITAGTADRSDRMTWPKHYRDWLRLTADALSYMVFTGNGALRTNLDPKRHILDRAEIGHIRYWIGVALAKHLTAKHLGLSHLIKIDRIGPRKDIRTISIVKVLNRIGKEVRWSPDFIGCDSALHWHVVEAKCRKALQTVLETFEWTEKAKCISTINGLPPQTSSVCCTIIDEINTVVDWWDPAIGQRDSSFDIEIELQMFLASYYKGLRAMISDTLHNSGIHAKVIRDNLEFVCIPLTADTKRYWIGLPRMIQDHPGVSWDLIHIPFFQQFESAFSVTEEVDDSNDVEYIGRDAVMVTFGPPAEELKKE